ncbi:hypothetical protein [Jannaschia sp. R86511]|uniref:hypothetical protein n=1 Tax=Jannaschia sp. R86511 TaxID=3093853 RepID=UPI0036D33609
MDTTIDASREHPATPTTAATTTDGARTSTSAARSRTRRPGATRPWQWLVGLGVAAGVNTALSLDAVAPVQTKDEIGYLMAARLLGGGGGADLIMPPHAGGYSAGWGLLVSPLWRVIDDPVRFMHVTVAFNVLLATLAVVVWAAVARRLGATPRAALAVAVVVAVAPGRALYTGYALPEALIGVIVATAFLLVLRLWDDGSGRGPAAGAASPPVAGRTGTAFALAGLTGYLSLVHSRFLPTVGLLVLVLAWWAWRVRPRSGPWVVALAAVGAGGGVVVNRLVEAALYGEVDRFSAAGDQIGQLHLGFMTSLTVGHAWYGAVAWGGLTVIGVIWAARRALVEWRARTPGPWSVLLLVTAAQLVIAASYLSTRLTVGAGRLDQVVYGRYTDPIWSLLAVVGLTVLVTRRLDRTMWRQAMAAVALLGVAVAVVLFAVGGIVRGLVQLNVPGIEMWRWEHGVDDLRVPFVQATVMALVLLAGIRWAQVRRLPAALVVGVVAVLAVSGTFVAEHRTIDERDQGLRDLFSLREVVDENPTAPVLLVVDRPLLLTGTAFQYWLGDREHRVLDPAQEAVRVEPGELVIGTLDPRPLMIGAPTRLVEIDPTYRYGVWQAEGGPVDRSSR